MLWEKVPRLWPRKTMVIIACGPSLTKDQVAYVRDRPRGSIVIAVNNSWSLAPWADVLYACDFRWWQTYKPKFDGFKISQINTEAKFPTVIIPGLIYVRSADKPGLSLDRTIIHQGGSSGFQALNLAVHLGAKKIILLGFDARADKDKVHWHKDHPAGLFNPDECNFLRWRLLFGSVPGDLEKAGVEVINCSPGSALDVFQSADLREAI